MIFNPDLLPLAILTILLVIFALVLDWLDILR